MEGPERPIGAIAVRTPPGVEIRPVGRGDLDAVVGMARALHGAPPLADVSALAPRLDAVIGSADVVPLLAIEDEAAVGLGVLEFRRRLNATSFEGWISELCVRNESRKRGIGSALLEGMVAEWRLRRGYRLTVKVDRDADARSSLLAGAGMDEWMHDFRMRPIHPPGEAPLPEGVRIRTLQASDADAVTGLIAQFGSRRTPAPERMDAVRRVFAEHADRVAAGEAGSTVAEDDGRLVGVCTLEWQRPFWTDETHAWLPDLVVDEPSRRRGIGHGLVADALRRAAAVGASQLSLETGTLRTAAQALYRSIGFEEHGRTYLLRRADEA